MANIRINSLPPDAAPSQSDVLPVDGLTTRKTTIVQMVDAARPFASQAEAEAGVATNVGMNPLTTAQAIAAQGATQFATASQGALASTALQPAAIGTTVQAHDALLDSVSGLALSAGDILYATGSDTVARLPIGPESHAIISQGGLPVWSPAGVGDLLAVNNLDDLDSTAAALVNLGLGAPGVSGLAILAATSADAARQILELPNVWTLRPGGTAAQMIAAIDAGQGIVVNPDVTGITLTTTAQVQSLLGAMDNILVLGGLFTVTLPSGQHAISAASNVRSPRVKLMGAAPVSTTLSSITSVSGSAGAWTVVGVVANGTGIAVGDVLDITAVTPGVQAPGTYTTVPVRGALQLQFFQSGELSAVGTAWSTTSDPQPTMDSGDLVFADGQVHRLTAISGTGFTSDAPAKNFSAKQYWYSMKSSGAGTMTISGTTATCSGAFINTHTNVGDILVVSGFGVRQIKSRDSTTVATLDASGMDVGVGAVWGVITPGEVHEGAWVVTAVAGNTITWTNTSRAEFSDGTDIPPPIVNINGGTVAALKTVLTFSGTSGFVVDDCTFEMDQIGMTGSGGSATVAFELRGVGSTKSGRATLGSSMAVNGFHYGSRTANGGVIRARDTVWGGQVTRGHDFAESGFGDFTGATVNGSGGIGIFIGTGCAVRLSDAVLCGNASQGVRMEVGASTWADFPAIGYNAAGAAQSTGGVLYHFVGARMLGNGAYGLNAGGFGRATGIIALGNTGSGVTMTGRGEMDQAILMGNGDDGLTGINAIGDMGFAGIGYNVSSGIQTTTHSDINCNGTNFYGQPNAILAATRSEIYAADCGFEGNTTDASALTGGEIYIEGHTGATTFSPTLNQRSADSSLVSDGNMQGAAVPNAAGAAPTKAEFDALLASLRSRGVIAT
jgi:hypothetical protein